MKGPEQADAFKKYQDVWITMAIAGFLMKARNQFIDEVRG